MNEKISKLAEILIDYRADEGLNPKKNNIRQWISQFSKENQEIILDEMIHICKKFYFSKKQYKNFLIRLVAKYDKSYWETRTILQVQIKGESQKEMVSILTKLLKKKYSLDVLINDYSKRKYIYVDDFLFSGVKLKGDLLKLKEKVQKNIDVDVQYMGYFSFGKYSIKKELDKQSIKVNFNNEWNFENRKSCKNISDVLLPIDEIYKCKEVKNFIKDSSNLLIRDEEKSTNDYCYDQYYIFSSQENRKVLEEEFTLAGLRIIDKIRHNGWAKPLGFSSFNNLGFGAMVFSYRNCPNNTPLCLWWGSWNSNQIWYPLFRRKTY